MAKDLFTKGATVYARYRPRYPQALYHYLIPLVKERQKAWDCATGNGQAAFDLAPYFQSVEATDISEGQLRQAQVRENIRYSVSPAEAPPFADDTFDLITVAQAYHWLNWEAFHQEAVRVARKGSLIAIWTYNRPETGHPRLDALLDHFYYTITGPYWEEERRHVDANYETVVFPFSEVVTKTFDMEEHWSYEELAGYLSTWSAVQKYTEVKGSSPLHLISQELKALWGPERSRKMVFPLYLKHGRIIK